MKKKILKKKNINITLFNNHLIFKGPLGSLTYVMPLMSNSTNNSFYIKKNKKNFFINQIKNYIDSVNNGWFFQLYVEGKGFKLFKYKDYICFDLGYSNLFLLKNISTWMKTFLVKKKLIFFGIKKNILYDLGGQLKKFYPHDKYHGKGIFLMNKKTN